MLRLAITGGLGSGKSTVSALLRGRGVPVVDADRLGHELLQNEARDEVREQFGTAEPAALAELVFAPGAGARLEQLNRILHARIMAKAGEQLRQWECAGKAMAGVEAALLIEAGLLAGFDRVVVVAAGAELRVQRYLQRGGTRAQALARMAHQLPDAAKVEQADIVIDNNGPESALLPQVERMLWQLGAREGA
ncbi:MAG: dephospho-CoA kinase [Terriglobales bacterium]